MKPLHPTPDSEIPTISPRDATLAWARIEFLCFGGPAEQISLMHRELAEKRRWVSDGRFLHALNCCMLLPGGMIAGGLFRV